MTQHLPLLWTLKVSFKLQFSSYGEVWKIVYGNLHYRCKIELGFKVFL